ncbi:AT DNA binding protein [Peziza echinospora]|nr:AT DNA binding protein [Peziza echinospora]
MPAKKRSAPPPATGNAGPDGHEAADDVPKRARRSLRPATRSADAKGSQGNGGEHGEWKQKTPAISKQKWVKTEKDAANTPIPISTTRQPSPEASSVSRSYWLIKSEPTTRLVNGIDVKFSIDDLASIGDAGEGWNGVRNYAARNNLRNMRLGDQVLFYHSNCKEPGIVGIAEIVAEATVDETAFDPTSPYYDAKSTRENPKWSLVKVKFVRKLARLIGLQELKANEKLRDMQLVKMGRLSVSPVTEAEWNVILGLEKTEG